MHENGDGSKGMSGVREDNRRLAIEGGPSRIHKRMFGPWAKGHPVNVIFVFEIRFIFGKYRLG